MKIISHHQKLEQNLRIKNLIVYLFLAEIKELEIISIEPLMHQFLYLELMNLNLMDSFHNLI